MDAELIKDDGSTVRLSEYGVVQDFVVSSIPLESQRESVEGRPGNVDFGAYLGTRTIKVPMILKAGSMQHVAHLRDKLYGLLTERGSYKIREMRRKRMLQYDFVDFGEKPRWSDGTDNGYVNGRQYEVRLTNVIEPNQHSMNAEVELEFETVGLPYAETIYTTKELNDSGYDAMVAKYGLVDGIDQDYTKYAFKAGVATANLSGEGYKNGTLFTGTGAESSHSDRLISSGSIGVSPNRGYVFEDTLAHPDIRYWNIYEFDNSGNFIKFSTTLGGDGNNHKVRFYNEGRYIRLMAINAEGVSLNASDIGTKMNPLVRVDHRVNTFSVWNAGNVAIEPEFMDLKIRLNYTYSADGVTIKNLTTGETFELDVELNGSHVVLDGISVMYGNINGLRKSNRKFIRLAPGLNEFEITADMYEEAIIDFKYYYR